MTDSEKLIPLILTHANQLQFCLYTIFASLQCRMAPGPYIKLKEYVWVAISFKFCSNGHKDMCKLAGPDQLENFSDMRAGAAGASWRCASWREAIWG